LAAALVFAGAVLVAGLATFALSFEVVNDALHPANEIANAEIVSIKISLVFIIFSCNLFFL
jgi:hypothetical protein